MAVPGGKLNKLSVSTFLAVSAFCFLSWVSPLKAYAESVTMQFTGVGGNNSGGVYTYPYDFIVTPTGGGPSQDLSLMCISFNQEIFLQTPNETWTATVVTAGSLGAFDEEEAYLYTQAVANASSNTTMSGAANWADWALGESSTLAGQKSFLASHISGTELTDADNYLTGLSGVNLAPYADYLVYVPVPNSELPLSDGLPQTFVGGPPPVPEPSSLILFGSGLLAAAGAFYRRKRRTA
jgi:hypothetical protein